MPSRRTRTSPAEVAGLVACPREATAPQASRLATGRERWKPAPAKLRRAIAKGDEVDYDALMRWWTDHCPERLRGLAPDTAALLSGLTKLRDGSTPPVSINYVER